MGFQLIQHDEPLVVDNIVALLFGDPGTGKSSLGFTSENPLLMDFDKGLQRTVGRKASVRFDTWADALAFVESDIIQKEGIQTLVADTAGTMLDDYLAHHILGMGIKGVDNGAGGLGLRGYGVMKDGFAKFLVACKAKKVDIVFICHAKKEDDGDAKKFFPQLTGGSYDILVSKADLIGYMEMVGDQITLDFNPTARHTGKNCAGFKKLTLPHFTSPEYSDFLSKIIQATKDHMRKQNDSQVKAVALVEDFKEKIVNVDSLASLELLKESIENLSPIYKAQVLQLYGKQYAELWAIEHIDIEKTSTPDDFKNLSLSIKALPKHIASELQSPFKKLMDSKGMRYDKERDSFDFIKQTEPTKQPVKAEPVASEKPEVPAEKPEVKPEPVAEKKEPKKAAAKKKEEPPVELIVRDEKWFLDRIGKKVMMKSEKAIEEVTIPDENQAYHFFAVTQKYKKMQFFDLGELESAGVVSEAEAIAQ